jgi:hypothetical protein
LALAVTAVVAVPAWGQFITTVTDFEAAFSPPGDGLANVIFLDPSVSTSSRGINTSVFNDVYLCSLSTCGSFFQQVCSGQQSLTISWQWTDPASATSWLRLSSTNTPWIPNPSLHLAGKVRFCLGGTAFTNDGFGTEVSGGNILMAIGVRETGVGVPLGANGGTAGDVEWVGLSENPLAITAGPDGVCDTTADPEDIQAAPVGTSPADGVCVTAGPDRVLNTPEAALVGDDERLSTPRGTIVVPLDRVMRQYEFDLAALDAAGAVYPLLGDGSLGAVPNNRGVWENFSFTNHPQNSTVNAKQVLLWLDDVVFEAPIPSPPTIVTLPNPPLPLDTSVGVTNIIPTATLLELYMLGRGTEPDFLLASVADPGTTDLTVPLDIPLPYGVSIVARQTVNGVESDNSAAVGINVPGNAPIRLTMSVRETDQYDHDLNCGDDGTGFDPNQPSTLEFIGTTATDGFGIPRGRRILPMVGWQDITFNPCPDADGVFLYSGNGVMDLNAEGHTNGVWEGLFFRIDALAPSAGPYRIYIDDMVAINGEGDGVDCLVDDFESYEVQQYIVEGTTAGTADSIAEGDDVQIVPPGSPTYVGQIIISGGPNRVIDTTPAGGEGITNNRARFQSPSAAGGSQNLASTPDITAIDDTQAYSGSNSLRVEWGFVNASNPLSLLRLTTNGSVADPPPDLSRIPDPVIPFSLDGSWCDGLGGDISYSFKLKIEPSPIQGDCDDDLDVDLADYACFQECATQSPLSPLCQEKFDYFNDGSIDADDMQMFLLSVSGPL